ncbi:MAG TPA: SGNH/GDSL hydrolase family protein [Casimicrobiaceae bacterium]|nr:SGNH/GDSL hydrolase family protein [Casimicrobiaceae bacterium]
MPSARLICLRIVASGGRLGAGLVAAWLVAMPVQAGTLPAADAVTPPAAMAPGASVPILQGPFAPVAPPTALASLGAPPSWDDAFAAFAAEDRASPPPDGGILFVGSSSIRMWRGLEDDFAVRRVVLKRGFGGSQLADCVRNLGRLVVRYHPALVLVYAGDNDLAAGVLPGEVLRRFVAFADGVHQALPATRIDFISIKPSPLRAALLPRIRETNALIRDYVADVPGLRYIDVFTPMLDADGQPRGELFAADRLHLNSDGYALWRTVIGPYVQQAAR